MPLGISLIESYSAAVSYAGTKGLISFLLEESDGPAQRGAHAHHPRGSRDPTREK